MGKLYVVSTPIGNLEDITFRAKRILLEAEIIACEDTRKTGILLKKLKEIQPPSGLSFRFKPKLISYYEENEIEKIPKIIKFLKEGKNVVLISSSGTPTISDPGFKLVKECIKQKIEIEAIPGPSAVLTSLVSSGLPTNRFLFLGYLPKKKNKRQKLLKNVLKIYELIRPTIIFFESPHRLLKTLKEIEEIFGQIEIVVCRELTKVYEEIKREKIPLIISHFEKNPPKGEFTILFNILQGLKDRQEEDQAL